MKPRNHIKTLIILQFLSACKGPASDGVLTHTLKDEKRAIILEHILGDIGLEFQLDGTTFTYQADDWKKYSQAEEDTFNANKIVMKRTEDKKYLNSVFQKYDIKFIEIEQDSDSLFLWWAVDDNQERDVSKKIAEW